MLIAEDLLLLLTHDGTGKLVVSGAQVDLALGGALLVELTLAERVDVAGPGERVREGRLIVKGAGPAGDAMLDHALSTLTSREGKKPQAVVARLGKNTRTALYERLAAAGVVREQRGRILGVFPTRRWPTVNPRPEADLRATLGTALRNGRASDPRTGALVSLLSALKAVHKVIEPESVGLSKKALAANAKRIAEGDWAAKAVQAAIASMNAAIAAASVAAAAAGASGSS